MLQPCGPWALGWDCFQLAPCFISKVPQWSIMSQTQCSRRNWSSWLAVADPLAQKDFGVSAKALSRHLSLLAERRGREFLDLLHEKMCLRRRPKVALTHARVLTGPPYRICPTGFGLDPIRQIAFMLQASLDRKMEFHWGREGSRSVPPGAVFVIAPSVMGANTANGRGCS